MEGSSQHVLYLQLPLKPPNMNEAPALPGGVPPALPGVSPAPSGVPPAVLGMPPVLPGAPPALPGIPSVLPAVPAATTSGVPALVIPETEMMNIDPVEPIEDVAPVDTKEEGLRPTNVSFNRPPPPHTVLAGKDKRSWLYTTGTYRVHADKDQMKDRAFCMICWDDGKAESDCWRAHGGGTTNLRKHTRSRDQAHQAFYGLSVKEADEKPAPKPSTAKPSVSSPTPTANKQKKLKRTADEMEGGTGKTSRRSSAVAVEGSAMIPLVYSHSAQIADAITDMVIRGVLPLVDVESPSFRQVIEVAAGTSTAAKKVDHVSKDQVIEILREKLTIIRSRVKTLLHAVSSVSLSLDSWTSDDGRGILRLDAHFIDQAWCSHSATAAVKLIERSHSAKDGSSAALLASSLSSILTGLGASFGTLCIDDTAILVRAGRILVNKEAPKSNESKVKHTFPKIEVQTCVCEGMETEAGKWATLGRSTRQAIRSGRVVCGNREPDVAESDMSEFGIDEEKAHDAGHAVSSDAYIEERAAQALKKARIVIDKLLGSALVKEKLFAAQTRCGGAARLITPMNKRHWWSAGACLKSLIAIRTSIETAVADMKKEQRDVTWFQLLPDDWEMLAVAAKVIGPFTVCQKLVEGGGLSMAAPCVTLAVRQIYDLYWECLGSDRKTAMYLASSSVRRILDGLMQRFYSHVDVGSAAERETWAVHRSVADKTRLSVYVSDGALLATFLDPRFKSLKFLSESLKVKAEMLARAAMMEILDKEAQDRAEGGGAHNGVQESCKLEQPQQQAQDWVDVAFEDMMMDPVASLNPHSTSNGVGGSSEGGGSSGMLSGMLSGAYGQASAQQVTRELNDYRNATNLKATVTQEDALQWWRSQSKTRLLSILARKWLCAPAMSARSQRLLEVHDRFSSQAAMGWLTAGDPASVLLTEACGAIDLVCGVDVSAGKGDTERPAIIRTKTASTSLHSVTVID